MLDFWSRALTFPAVILAVALLIWGIDDALNAALFFSTAISIHLLLQLRHLGALEHWAMTSDISSVPEGSGLWEEVFVRLNKLMRKQRETKEKYKAALHQIEQAISALPEGVVILDATGHVEWCNPLAEQHFGLDSARDMGQQITYLARQPDFVKYLAAGEFNEPLILRNTRQDDLVLCIKVVPYGSSKQLLISRDVTQLERIETMRRDFVANVSHELRTPLTVVNGFVETLQDMPALNKDMPRRALQLMGEQTQRMANLVDDLLALSRLENSENVLQEENVHVPELLTSIHEESLSLSAGKQQLGLSIDCNKSVLGNTAELRSAFQNLVSNAIRYTPEGGHIHIRWHQDDLGRAIFSVQDDGIGIAPQHIARLTERFYRVDNSRSRETGGTGLGMAIVKHIVSRHQAELSIQSEESIGSTFSIIFPARRIIA